MVMPVKMWGVAFCQKLPRSVFKPGKENNWGIKKYAKWEDIESIMGGLIEDDSVTFVVRVKADEPQRCMRCEERTCKVCLKEEACMMFDPCGHLSTCKKCSTDLNECPICRKKIEKKNQAFV